MIGLGYILEVELIECMGGGGKERKEREESIQNDLQVGTQWSETEKT